MNLRATVLLAASSLAIGLATPALAQEAKPAASAAATEPASVEQQDAMKDWGFGVQTRYIDKSTKPGDDFNQYVNGLWLNQAEIPADRSSTGGFIQLRDLSEERMKKILEEAAAGTNPEGSPRARVAAVWKAFMDTDAIEAAGLVPLYPTLEKIYAARSLEDLVGLFVMPGIASPIGMGVRPDAKNSSVNALYAGQAQLGLPDRDYYLVDSPKNREIVAKYKTYLTFILGEVGYPDPAKAAEAVFQLETKMARANWDRALGRNRDLTYNKMPIAEFLAFAPEVPLRAALDSRGLAT